MGLTIPQSSNFAILMFKCSGWGEGGGEWKDNGEDNVFPVNT